MGRPALIAVVDTNCLIDFLADRPGQERFLTALRRLIAHDNEFVVPLLVAVEIRAGVDRSEHLAFDRLLDVTRPRVRVSLPDLALAYLAVDLRRERRLTLPDAFVLATALAEGADVLLSRDARLRAEGGALGIPPMP